MVDTKLQTRNTVLSLQTVNLCTVLSIQHQIFFNCHSVDIFSAKHVWSIYVKSDKVAKLTFGQSFTYICRREPVAHCTSVCTQPSTLVGKKQQHLCIWLFDRVTQPAKQFLSQIYRSCAVMIVYESNSPFTHCAVYDLEQKSGILIKHALPLYVNKFLSFV